MYANRYNPRETETEESQHQGGQGRVRAAIVIGTIAPLYEWGYFIALGLQSRAWHGESRGLVVLPAVAGAIAIALVAMMLWIFGYPILHSIALLVHAIFAAHVSSKAWIQSTNEALSVLPWAAGLGVLTWLVYSISGWGGWPGDMIFGIVGNLIGAWCYLTLLLGWFHLWRAPQ